MARERNNIYAIAADAVDLALDTAGTIGSLVGGIVGVGNKSDETGRRDADNAADRVATSLKQEADAVKASPRRASAHKAGTSKVRATKRRSTATAKRAGKRPSARKTVH